MSSHLPTYGAPPPSARSAGPLAEQQLTVRPMTGRDIRVVASIEADAHPVDAWSPEAFGAAVDALRTYICRVATDRSGAVVAYAIVSIAADQADLQNLTVRADHRRRGLGRRLLGEVLAEARRRGAGEIFLEVRHDNAAAIALYHSYGFVDVGRRRDYYAREVDAILMQTRLTGAPWGGRRP